MSTQRKRDRRDARRTKPEARHRARASGRTYTEQHGTEISTAFRRPTLASDLPATTSVVFDDRANGVESIDDIEADPSPAEAVMTIAPSELIMSRASSVDSTPSPVRRKKRPYGHKPKSYDPMLDSQLWTRVRGAGHTLQWWDFKISQWVPAVYHHEIRDQLIARASEHGRYGYTDPAVRASGPLGPTDVTAFVPGQYNWYKDDDEVDYSEGDDESQHVHNVRDDILSWEGSGDDYQSLYDVNRMPDRWYENGRLVIDRGTFPMYILPDLPVTLSSAIEPWLLAALVRLDRRIIGRDIWARCPPNSGTLTKYRNKTIRFCQFNGLWNWSKRLPQRGAVAREGKPGVSLIGPTRAAATRKRLRRLEPQKKTPESSDAGPEVSETEGMRQAHLPSIRTRRGLSQAKGRASEEAPTRETSTESGGTKGDVGAITLQAAQILDDSRSASPQSDYAYYDELIDASTCSRWDDFYYRPTFYQSPFRRTQKKREMGDTDFNESGENSCFEDEHDIPQTP